MYSVLTALVVDNLILVIRFAIDMLSSNLVSFININLSITDKFPVHWLFFIMVLNSSFLDVINIFSCYVYFYYTFYFNISYVLYFVGYQWFERQDLDLIIREVYMTYLVCHGD